MSSFPTISWNSDGLLPVIVQEDQTGEVLMMAWMNEQALALTIETGFMHYYSRSRKNLWKKGESSKQYQHVRALFLDCDDDTLLARVSQEGVACHTGRKSCFFKRYNANTHTWDDALPVIVSPSQLYSKADEE